MIELLFSPTVITTLGVVVAVTVGVAFAAYALRVWLRDRPTRRTSAYDRLLVRNPTLNADRNIRWTVRSRRVRFGWLTTLAVTVAVLVAATRPATETASSEDR